jgi:hypothetical protein
MSPESFTQLLLFANAGLVKACDGIPSLLFHSACQRGR